MISILLGYCIYFLLFELVQMIFSRGDYLKDFWNLFDFSRVVLMIAYCSVKFVDQYQDDAN